MAIPDSDGEASKRETWPCDVADYTLERLIGRGAFAQVFTARCLTRKTSERVALKVMDLDQITTDLANISKEVQMMRMCCHINVLSCYTSFVSKSELYLVMPLMEKGSCLHIMHSAKDRGLGEGMAEEWLGYILNEVLHGLQYLHANGHIHRDIKAGNVLLDPDGKVALADFGVSSWLVHAGCRKRTAKTFVGTPCWMAPEVMEQVDGYDYKADIWSFGITALELAKGFAPYAFLPPMKVLLLTIQEEPPSLRTYSTEKSCTGESFSRSFKEMVRMCLQKEARKRPTVQTLLNCKFFKTTWLVDPLVKQLLSHIDNITASDKHVMTHDRGPGTMPIHGHTTSLRDNEVVGNARFLAENSGRDTLGAVSRTFVSDRVNHQGASNVLPSCSVLTSCPEEDHGNGDYAQGTTWTFDDGHEVVLKSESFIRREIDAKSAQDAQECEAIFDDLESLMNRRGGEWDFRKNQDVQLPLPK